MRTFAGRLPRVRHTGDCTHVTTTTMPALFALLFRLLAFAAGLVLAASLLAVTLVAGALLAAHAGWRRLTGRPRTLVFGTRRGTGFGWMAQRRPQPVFVPRSAPRHARARDVTDVKAK
jgi:hypothetical protein